MRCLWNPLVQFGGGSTCTRYLNPGPSGVGFQVLGRAPLDLAAPLPSPVALVAATCLPPFLITGLGDESLTDRGPPGLFCVLLLPQLPSSSAGICFVRATTPRDGSKSVTSKNPAWSPSIPEPVVPVFFSSISSSVVRLSRTVNRSRHVLSVTISPPTPRRARLEIRLSQHRTHTRSSSHRRHAVRLGRQLPGPYRPTVHVDGFRAAQTLASIHIYPPVV